MPVAKCWFHSSGGLRSHNSCWDFYFLKKKMREEVEEGKGGKSGEGELWGKARDRGKPDRPHWAPVNHGRPVWAAMSQGFRAGLTTDVCLNPVTPAVSLELERRAVRSTSLKTVLFLQGLTSSHTHLPQSLSFSVFFLEFKLRSSSYTLNFIFLPSILPKLLLWVTSNPRSSCPFTLWKSSTHTGTVALATTHLNLINELELLLHQVKLYARAFAPTKTCFFLLKDR